jgi:ABC-2 type transport system permease protein
MNAGFMGIFPLTFLSNVFVEPDTLPSALEAFVNATRSRSWRPRRAG